MSSSWYAHIESMEQGKGQCTYAAIVGQNPLSFWAESTDKSAFPITIEDVSNIIRAITTQDMSIMGTGIKIGGKLNFTCLRMEPDLLICQGKGENKNHSLVVALSIQACIIGFNADAEVKTSSVREGVEIMCNYLKNNNY